MKKILSIVVFLLLFQALSAQQSVEKKEDLGLITWMSFAEMEKEFAKKQKPVMIDVYTDWCGWCKKMMSTTFSHPVIADYINRNFYPVRFNAETRDSIAFLGKKYYNKGAGTRASHELAISLLGGKLSYPTIVFFNSNFQFKLIVPGYLDVKGIEPVLVYTLESVFNTTTVDDFRKNYVLATTPDSLRPGAPSVAWMSLDETAEKTKTQPRKIMMFMNTNWSNSGRIMANGTFRDSTVVNYLSGNFYPVFFDPETKSEITFQGAKYINDGKYGSFHQLAVQLSGGKLTIPSVVFLDSGMNVISTVPQYFTPADMNMILHFFGEDAYKTTKWEDYRKDFK